MESAIRRLVTIVTEATLERELIHALERLGVTGYTLTDARGRGHRGVRTSAWEFGSNIRAEIICEERLADRIVQHLREHYYDNYAMIIFIADVQVLRPEKF